MAAPFRLCAHKQTCTNKSSPGSEQTEKAVSIIVVPLGAEQEAVVETDSIPVYIFLTYVYIFLSER